MNTKKITNLFLAIASRTVCIQDCLIADERPDPVLFDQQQIFMSGRVSVRPQLVEMRTLPPHAKQHRLDCQQQDLDIQHQALMLDIEDIVFMLPHGIFNRCAVRVFDLG